MRGLSPMCMAETPAIHDWVHGLVSNDLVLKRSGVSVLREIAAAGYHNRNDENATEKTSPYRTMLSALWRDSPVPTLEPCERLATMASLLHVDRHGSSLAAALIRASGLAPADWLRAYVDTYPIPLVHSELVRAARAQRSRDVRAEVPDDEKLLSIFTDAFDCIFGFLSPQLDREGLLTPAEFWSVVTDAVRDYQAATPELAEAIAKYDIFAPSFALSCLNRLQLRNTVDLAGVAGALLFVGSLDNPLCG